MGLTAKEKSLRAEIKLLRRDNQFLQDSLGHEYKNYNRLQEEIRLLKTQLKDERDANGWRAMLEEVKAKAKDHEKRCPTLGMSGLIVDGLQKLSEKHNIAEVRVHPPGSVTPSGIVVQKDMKPEAISAQMRMSLGQRLKKNFGAMLRRVRKEPIS